MVRTGSAPTVRGVPRAWNGSQVSGRSPLTLSGDRRNRRRRTRYTDAHPRSCPGFAGDDQVYEAWRCDADLTGTRLRRCRECSEAVAQIRLEARKRRYCLDCSWPIDRESKKQRCEPCWLENQDEVRARKNAARRSPEAKARRQARIDEQRARMDRWMA